MGTTIKDLKCITPVNTKREYLYIRAPADPSPTPVNVPCFLFQTDVSFHFVRYTLQKRIANF